MNIALINPPQLFSRMQVAAGVTPPLGLLYLAASLRQAGHDPIIIDSVVEDADHIYGLDGGVSCRGLGFRDILDRIPSNVEFLGISNLFSFAFPIVKALTEELKRAFPHVPLSLGGAHPSAMPIETVSEPSIDFAVISEGDHTFTRLVENASDCDIVSRIDGLAYKDGNGVPRMNPKTRFIQNLDELPNPARDLIPMEKYYAASEAHGPTRHKWTPILSSRGCPFNCTFCTPGLWGRNYRARSAKNVLDEMEACISRYGITEFHFEDENLTVDKKRVMGICKGILDRNLRIEWQTPNGIRASVTDEEMLNAMKEAGCCHITVAPESGSWRVLNEIIKKRQDLQKVTSVVRHASRIGMKTAAYFVIGLPGETVEEVKMSISYSTKLAKVGLDEVVFSNYVALPGSELFNKLVREGKFDGDWKNLVSMGDLTKSTSWSEHIPSGKLMKLRRKAYLKFHMTKGFHYPMKVIRSIINVLTKHEELKTERTLITFIKRMSQKKSPVGAG